MPSSLDDNEIEDLDPSTSSTLDDNGGDAKAKQPSTAASSPATGEDDELLNVVRDVVTESRSDQAASPAEGEDDGQSTDDDKPKEQDDEDFSDVPFHKHPRFQQLLRKSKAYEQDAKRYNNVQTFLDTAGLNAEEAADGLSIMGLMKTDPVEAWKQLKPTIQKLLVAAGEVLPEDLQRMVQEGKMDQVAALEVSRARAGVNASQVRQSFAEQRQQRQQRTTAVQALGGAATDWESRRRKNDPNFDAKFVPLQKEILFLQQSEGLPNTPEGVKEQLDKAYKAVNEQFKPANPNPLPKPKPVIKPVMGGQVAGNQRPAGDVSTLDIVRANRRAS
ncbi:hypothetical protein [Neorhizobium galegae]|uniref:hypothetical protein n=1 Tax=Neorhizobium galegae TaxID=399 RepID=UPI00062237B3|nr:hypothetical protein [Neorhizobium galegae]CDZ55096.1 Hypothetical protein NGAL_HAMBI2427_59980 [Neorhizobium galegae bv. orientalis]